MADDSIPRRGSASEQHAARDAAECWSEIHDPHTTAFVRESLASDSDVLRTTAIFSALADATRFRILDALARGELCVCDLADVVGVSQSATSHQLRLLRDRGLVAHRREGQRAVYRLADEHVRTLIGVGLEHAAEGPE
jgi:ArsR family transcriptional regulator